MERIVLVENDIGIQGGLKRGTPKVRLGVTQNGVHLNLQWNQIQMDPLMNHKEA